MDIVILEAQGDNKSVNSFVNMKITIKIAYKALKI